MTELRDPMTANNTSKDSINFKLVLYVLGNRFIFVACGLLLGIAAGVFHAKVSPKVWESHFDILLSDSNTNAGGFTDSGILSKLSGLSGSSFKSDINTKVLVLGSPLVLQPVYDELTKNGFLSPSSTPYSTWSRRFKFSNPKGTNYILASFNGTSLEDVSITIEYLKKEIIRYSKSDYLKSINSSIDFASGQIEIFKEKASNAVRERDSYALKHGIKVTSSESQFLPNLDSKLPTNTRASGFSGSFNSSSQSLKGIGNSDILPKLTQINEEIIKRQAYFKDNDPVLIGLTREKESLKRLLDLTLGGNLSLPSSFPKSSEDAQAILLKYSQLDRNATNLYSTLSSLESSLLGLRLKSLQEVSSWQIISSPFTKPGIIKPIPSKSVGLGAFIGLLLGSSAALIYDSYRNKVSFLDSAIEIIGSKPVFKVLHPSDLRICASILAKRLDRFSTIRLLHPSSNTSDNLSVISLQEALSNQNSKATLISDSCIDATPDEAVVLVITAKIHSVPDLQKMLESISASNLELSGWIWLDIKNRDNATN